MTGWLSSLFVGELGRASRSVRHICYIYEDERAAIVVVAVWFANRGAEPPL